MLSVSCEVLREPPTSPDPPPKMVLRHDERHGYGEHYLWDHLALSSKPASVVAICGGRGLGGTLSPGVSIPGTCDRDVNLADPPTPIPRFRRWDSFRKAAASFNASNMNVINVFHVPLGWIEETRVFRLHDVRTSGMVYQSHEIHNTSSSSSSSSPSSSSNRAGLTRFVSIMMSLLMTT